MIIRDIEFIGSFEYEDQCPKTDLPEYAFIGRSNVGKSSLINLMTGRTDLARISSTPGKTQSINYFLINKSWYIVDLPGYGYAKVSKKMREKWQRNINYYLTKRMPLHCVFSLIDSRHPLQDADLNFVNWMGEKGIPYALVYTKTDKVKDQDIEEHIDRIEQRLLEHWEVLPQTFRTSTVRKTGGEDILAFIEEINNK
jgi:GTP-binding protein